MGDARDAIRDELTEIDREAEVLVDTLEHMRGEDGASLPPELYTAGLAKLTEGLYTGSERLLSVIAREIDRAPIDKSESWHRELLDRMASPFQNRQAVLSPETVELLDMLRGFRHKVRISYSRTLDAEIVVERTEQAIKLAGLLRRDIDGFLAASASDA